MNHLMDAQSASLCKATAPASWRLENPVLLRIAGLELALLHTLRQPGLARRLERLDALQAAQARQRQWLCDTILFRAAGQGAEREAWIALRRRVAKGQALRAAELSLIDQMPQVRERAQLRRHAARQVRLVRAQQHFEVCYARANETARLRLCELLQREDVGAGLMLGAPGLMERVQGLLARAPSQWRKAERQTEATVLRYLIRAAAKTSPFGRWGWVAAAQLAPAHSGGLHVLQAAQALRSRSQLSLGFCADLARQLLARPQLRLPSRWLLNPSFFENSGGWGFFAPDGLPFTRLRRGARQDRLSSLLEALRGSAGIARGDDEWIDWLMQQPSLQAQSADELRSGLALLQRAGLMFEQAHWHSDSPTPLRQLAQQLRQAHGHAVDELCVALEALQSIGEAWGTGDAKQRRASLAQIDALITQLGLQKPATPPVVEDSYLPGLSARLGSRLLGRLEASLSPVLDAFVRRDAGGLFQLFLKELFIQHYGVGGQCTQIHEFAAAVQKALQGQGASGLAQSRLAQQRKQRFMGALGARAREAVGELLLSPQQLSQALDEAQIPPLPDMPRSLAVHVQLLGDDAGAFERGEVLLVLNQVLPGAGRFFSRYGGLFKPRDWEQPLRAGLRQLGAQLDAEPLELQATLAHNAQLHPRLTERALCAPGEFSEQPGSLGLDGLVLRHDAARDALSFERDGRPVLPVYLGFFHSMALPPSLQVLSDALWLAHHPEDNRPVEHAERQRRAARERGEALDEAPVRAYARLRVGALVVQRRCWAVDVEALPDAGGSEAEQFAAWQAWVRQQGLPRQSFVRVGQRKQGYQFGDHKPVYLDIDSPQSLRCLLTGLDRGAIATLLFDEALPAPASAAPNWGHGPQALELQLQLWKESNDERT